LLSTLAAFDLGFIKIAELTAKLDAALTTMEGLERLEGHLFNWYDTQSLAALLPPLRLERGQRKPLRRADSGRRGTPLARARNRGRRRGDRGRSRGA